MDRNWVLAVCFLFLISADVSHASSSSSSSLLLKLRKLVADAGPVDKNNNSKPLQVSPSPSPDPVKVAVNNSNKTSNTTTSKDQPKVDSKGLNSDNNKTNNTETLGPPPQDKSKTKVEKNDKAKKKDGEAKPALQPEVYEDCPEGARRCRDQKSLVACVLSYDGESKQLLVLIQNQGEHKLSVDLTGLNPIDNALIEIAQNHTKKVNLNVGTRTKVVLKAGYGECVLHLDPPVSQGNFYLYLPTYEQLVTPINGAYFLIITVIVLGVIWACCVFRNRRRQGGIPYQELEMSMPESGAANNVQETEGWDQVWDDDWDEENAVKSPAIRHSGSISANGLTSRATNKDGWENDWDD